MTPCHGPRAKVPMSAFVGCPRSDARDTGSRTDGPEVRARFGSGTSDFTRADRRRRRRDRSRASSGYQGNHAQSPCPTATGSAVPCPTHRQPALRSTRADAACGQPLRPEQAVCRARFSVRPFASTEAASAADGTRWHHHHESRRTTGNDGDLGRRRHPPREAWTGKVLGRFSCASRPSAATLRSPRRRLEK
jgi:hypothetical protein